MMSTVEVVLLRYLLCMYIYNVHARYLIQHVQCHACTCTSMSRLQVVHTQRIHVRMLVGDVNVGGISFMNSIDIYYNIIVTV